MNGLATVASSDDAPFSDFIVYVDESGDHSLTSIDENYPVFVLAFCIFRKAIYNNLVASELRALKFAYFGHDMIVLHEHDIRKRNNAFKMMSQARREEFMLSLTGILERAEFVIVAVVIDKRRLVAKYSKPGHPYHLAMEYGLERLMKFLRARNDGQRITHVICEARGTREDLQLELEFRRICDGANVTKERYPFEILISDKKTNSAGLQIADLVARPIGLSVIRPQQENRAMEILKEKFDCDDRGQYQWYGLKVFP